MWWREIELKHEKVYKCFLQDCKCRRLGRECELCSKIKHFKTSSKYGKYSDSVHTEKIIFWRNRHSMHPIIIIHFHLLNPHSGYVKLDSYLLQFLCHVTSDVKFSIFIRSGSVVFSCSPSCQGDYGSTWWKSECSCRDSSTLIQDWIFKELFVFCQLSLAKFFAWDN